MNKLFFISGLGADKRAFNRIEEFKDYQKVFIDWKPNHKNESIRAYSNRIFEDETVQPNDIIIGLSFGGLIAIEIAKSFNTKNIILISSFRDNNDLKPFLKLLLKTRLHFFMPKFRTPILSAFLKNWFNVASANGVNLLNEMANNTDPILMKWSMKQIRLAKFEEQEFVTIHNIIGDEDKLLSPWKNNNTYPIPNAGHFMVYENAPEINKILRKIIEPPH